MAYLMSGRDRIRPALRRITTATERRKAMTITRRSVLSAGIGAGVTGLIVGWDAIALAQATRTRYSATSPQGKAMLVK
jgi:hypothetical protein